MLLPGIVPDNGVHLPKRESHFSTDLSTDIQGHRSIHGIRIWASDRLKPEDGRDEGLPLSYS
jgi:hypothetical protein